MGGGGAGTATGRVCPRLLNNQQGKVWDEELRLHLTDPSALQALRIFMSESLQPSKSMPVKLLRRVYVSLFPSAFDMPCSAMLRPGGTPQPGNAAVQLRGILRPVSAL